MTGRRFAGSALGLFVVAMAVDCGGKANEDSPSAASGGSDSASGGATNAGDSSVGGGMAPRGGKTSAGGRGPSGGAVSTSGGASGGNAGGASGSVSDGGANAGSVGEAGSGGAGGSEPPCPDCAAHEVCWSDGKHAPRCVTRSVRVTSGTEIDATEVTRGQYAAWLAEDPELAAQSSACAANVTFTAHAKCMADPSVCQGDQCARHPQPCVDYCDAAAYCKALGRHVCSDQEWVGTCSANGEPNSFYGSPTFISGVCNDYTIFKTTTVEVASMAGCQSPIPGFAGVHDLIGNVEEWADNCKMQMYSGETCEPLGLSFGQGAAAPLCNQSSYATRLQIGPARGFRCCSTACDLHERLEAEAGEAASDCGYTSLIESSAGVDACVVAAFNEKRPFLARYQRQGIDSEVVLGIVGDANGRVSFLLWDSDPSGGSGQPARISKTLCVGPGVNASPTRNPALDPPISCALVETGTTICG